mgnify:CR=1 FL=1
MNDAQLTSSALTQPVDTRDRLPLGALLALAAGWWGLRSVLRTPVVETLRKAPT